MRTLFAIVFASLMPGVALAHTGHELTGFAAGLLHPFMGWDHLLAFFCAGVWLIQAPLRQAIVFAGLFILALLAGAGLGLAGWQPPLLEQGVLLSVILLGILLAWRGRFAPLPVAGAVMAFFSLHGILHGAEMPLGSHAGLYFIGFLSASAVLLSSGYWLARTAPAVWLRLLGLGTLATVTVVGLV